MAWLIVLTITIYRILHHLYKHNFKNNALHHITPSLDFLHVFFFLQNYDLVHLQALIFSFIFFA